MKKLHLTLIVLFMLFAAQAQVVTEKSLLGEWRIQKIEVEGILINLETDEVTAVDPTTTTEDLELIRQMDTAELKGGKLVFKPGLLVEVHDGPTVEQDVSYTLTTKGKAQILTMNSPDEPAVLEIVFEGGFLKLTDYSENEKAVMYMAKTK